MSNAGPIEERRELLEALAERDLPVSKTAKRLLEIAEAQK